MLTLKNISKKYHEVEALKDVNITFRKKELVAILGPSGCGKTTLLNIIATLEQSDEGALLLGKDNLSFFRARKLDSYRSNYISYIFQNYNLINHLNVSDNVLMTMKLRGKTDSKKQAMELLKSLGLVEKVKKRPSKLSGGERQRAAIARSLVNNTPIILADEPSGALDTKNSEKVMKLLSKCAKEKLVIMVTHNEQLAKKYATRIIRMKDGKVLSDSNPTSQLNNDAYQYGKTKIKTLTAFKLSYNNLKNKKVRTYLTVLAFCIGLISLALVLSISKGFKKELANFEKETLYNYPLIISKETISLANAFKNNVENTSKGIIKIQESQTLIRNEIDDSLILKINEMTQTLIEGIAYYRDIPSAFKSVSRINPNHQYFDLLHGRFPKNKNEVLLLLTTEQVLERRVADHLNITEVPFDEVINNEIEVGNQTLKLVGIVKSNNSYFHDLSGILYDSALFTGEITDIYLYASSYENKIKIKDILNGYAILDEAETVVGLTSSLVNGITVVLVVFSAISLVVSLIMLSIISYISVLERQKEIGILKTMGASKKDIKKIFLIENMLIGLLASSLSLEIAAVLSKVINNYLMTKMNLKNIMLIDEQIMLLVTGFGLILTYLAGLIPARIAAKKNIVKILQNE